jgi:hypothetical protein
MSTTAANTPLVTVEGTHDGVATVTIDNPPANSLSTHRRDEPQSAPFAAPHDSRSTRASTT